MTKGVYHMPEENRESRTKFALSETLKALMRKNRWTRSESGS